MVPRCRNELPDSCSIGRRDSVGLKSTLNNRQQSQFTRHMLFFQLFYNRVQERLGPWLNPVNVGRVIDKPIEFAVNVLVADFWKVEPVEQSIPKVVITARIGKFSCQPVRSMPFFKLYQMTAKLFGVIACQVEVVTELGDIVWTGRQCKRKYRCANNS